MARAARALKILHVTLSFRPGGRREAIVSLARGLSALGIDSRLCCLDRFGAEPEVLDAVFARRLELQRRGLFDGLARRRLRDFVSEQSIDVLHAHDAASQFACAWALPFDRRPLLMTFHRSLGFESARGRDRLRNAVAGLRCKAIVVASRERRVHFLANNWIATRKLVRIPLGIDTERFRPEPARRAAIRRQLGVGDNCRLIGAAGHFGREKGIDRVIDAFVHLCRGAPQLPAALVVLGRGDEAQTRALDAQVPADLASRVHRVGFQSQPETWFPAFDLFLHGARVEAFGLVLVEAMACGVPVVASAVGGVPDIVDAACGACVTPGGSEQLGEAALQLLGDAGRLRTCASAARERATTRFALPMYAQRHAELYRNLLQGKAISNGE